jgi:uncharacterized protein YjbI with pentapeptide repeats
MDNEKFDYQQEIAAMGLDEESFDEYLKIGDETDDLVANSDYYVVKEWLETPQLNLKELTGLLPLVTIRSGQSESLDNQSYCIEVEGEYFPDLIEANDYFLVSRRFSKYLEEKTGSIKRLEYNGVVLVSDKHQRAEEYITLVPPELDCMVTGSAVYDVTEKLNYFELDQSKIGKHLFFKVKGFPHLMSLFKLNRIDWALECVRLDNYFDYAAKRDRDYQSRSAGAELTKARKDFERVVEVIGERSFKHELDDFCNIYKLRQASADGFKAVFGSFSGGALADNASDERFISFEISWQEGTLGLTDYCRSAFRLYRFELPFVKAVSAYLIKLPEKLQQPAKKLFWETLLNAVSIESKVFDKYELIHNNRRLRLFLSEAKVKCANQLLIYDFKNKFQREVETATSFVRLNLSNQDLREFDFSGKDLTGIKITGSDLSRTKLNGCLLAKAEFKDCNLTGTEFKKAQLAEAHFVSNEFDHTRFDEADLQHATITGSDLYHSNFSKANLTEAIIVSTDLLYVYFAKTKLFKTTFTVTDSIRRCVFRQCNLRNAVITAQDLEECDFRNSDLSESRMALRRILKTNFSKTKLNGADFADCRSLTECNLRYSSCAGINLAGVTVNASDLGMIDLSLMKFRQGTAFCGSKLIGTNLARFDFRGAEFSQNELRFTDLSGAHLEEIDFSTCEAVFPNLEGAFLADACFDEEQLAEVKLSAKQRNEITVLVAVDADETVDDTEMDNDHSDAEMEDDY